MLRKFFNSFAVICLLVIVFSLPSLAAQAASVSPAPAHQALSIPDVGALGETLKTLGGVAALIAAIVNMAKQIKLPNGTMLVQDGTAPAWSTVMNILAMIFIFYLRMRGGADLLPAIDAQSGQLATVLSTIVAFVVQIFFTRKIHDVALAGIPLVGKSNSGKVAGETQVIDVSVNG